MEVNFFSEPHIIYLCDHPSTKTLKAYIIQRARKDYWDPIVILNEISQTNGKHSQYDIRRKHL